MKSGVFICQHCGVPLRITSGQFVTICYACQTKIYVNQKSAPTIVLNPEISRSNACQIVQKVLAGKDIASNFLLNSEAKSATLFFIPFYEIKESHSGWFHNESPTPEKHSHETFEFLEKANDLKTLTIGHFNLSLVRNALSKAEQIDFNPLQIRKKGVIIPISDLELINKQNTENLQGSSEPYKRIFFFPVWEIKYNYAGMDFNNYISAITGEIIKIHAIGSHKQKLLSAIAGLLIFTIILSRGLKLFFLNLMGLPIPTLILSLVGIPLLGLLISILMPYFWRSFSQRETIEKSQGLAEYNIINYTHDFGKKRN